MTDSLDDKAWEPYAPVRQTHVYKRLNGSQSIMDAPVDWQNIDAYREEVRLIQQALGTAPDGIIGRSTRVAAQIARKAMQQYYGAKELSLIKLDDLKYLRKLVAEAEIKREDMDRRKQLVHALDDEIFLRERSPNDKTG